MSNSEIIGKDAIEDSVIDSTYYELKDIIQGILKEYKERSINSRVEVFNLEKQMYDDILSYTKDIDSKFAIYYNLYQRATNKQSKKFLEFVMRSLKKDLEDFKISVHDCFDIIIDNHIKIKLNNDKVNNLKLLINNTKKNFLTYKKINMLNEEIIKLTENSAKQYEETIEAISKISLHKNSLDYSQQSMRCTLTEYIGKYEETQLLID